MPLTVNVGLSRKESENFNSQGCSIHLAAELDQSLLARPDDLQSAINELYEQAEYALVRQAHSMSQKPLDQQAISPSSGNPGKNGHQIPVNGNGPKLDATRRGMTGAQRNAIFVIADSLGIDPIDEARHEFGIDLDHASISEASKLIGHLSSIKQAQARANYQ